MSKRLYSQHRINSAIEEINSRCTVLDSVIGELNLVNELLEEIPLMYENEKIKDIHEMIALRTIQYQEEKCLLGQIKATLSC